METLKEQEERSRVSSTTPVQTVVVADSDLVETEVSVEEMDENGVGDVSVVGITVIGGETKMKAKRGRKKKLKLQSEDGEKTDIGSVSVVKENGVRKSSRGAKEIVQVLGDSASKDEVKESQNGDGRETGSKEMEKEGEKEDEDDDEEKMSEQEEHDFSMGDLVWGKIKSHPWWPGVIYNSSDASEAAAKYKRRNRLLVAYYGDGTFAWCYPSQLKPFLGNFDKLAKQSNSKSFVRAVEEAENEISRRLDLEMACSFLADEQKPVKPVTLNAGIKEGVAVPDGGLGDLSMAQFVPAEVLAQLKCIAQVVSIHSMLDLLVLEHRLSAFYRIKGYNQLPKYHEPVGILSPADTTENGLVHRDNVEGQTADTSGSPVEADWLSSASGNGVGSTGITISRRGHGMSEDKLLQSKKQRSMAELLGGNANVKDDETSGGISAEEDSTSEKETARPKKKMDSLRSEVGSGSVVGVEGAISEKTKVGRKKKREGLSSEVENGSVVAEEGTRPTKATVERKKKGESMSESGNGSVVAEEGTASKKAKVGRKKKRESLSSEVAKGIVVAEEGTTPMKATVGRKNKGETLSEAGNGIVVAEEGTTSKKATVGRKKKKANMSSEVRNGSGVAAEGTPSEKATIGPEKERESMNSEVGNDSVVAEDLTISAKESVGSKTRKKDKNTKGEYGNDASKQGTLSAKTALAPRKRRKNRDFEVGNSDGLSENLTVSGKQTTGARARKRTQESKVEIGSDVVEEVPLSGKQTVDSRKKKKDKDFEVGTDKDVAAQLISSAKKPAESKKRKETMDSELNGSGIVEEGSNDSKKALPSKMPKKTKLTGLSNVKNNEVGSNGIVEEGLTDTKQASPSKMPEKAKLTDQSIMGEDKPSNSEDENEGSKSGVSLRERKKSKYLSPPYTNLGKWQRVLIPTNDSKNENPCISSVFHEEESITGAAGEPSKRPLIVKCSGKTSETELSKGPYLKSNTAAGATSPKPNRTPKKTAVEDGNASAHEMLSDFRSAALNPLHLKKKQSDDTVKGFFTKFRSSLYQDGSEKKVKRVTFETKPDSPGKDIRETGHTMSGGESEKKKRRKKKDNLPQSPKLSSKRTHGTSDMGMTHKEEANREGSMAALLVTFTPGVSLPTKDEFVTTFSRFGTVNESETEVIEGSGCAQVVYVSTSDAEKAYKDSDKISSLGSSVASYRLRYLPAVSRASENAGNSHEHNRSIVSPLKGGDTSGLQSTSPSQVGEVPLLPSVSQNLEMAKSMLEKSWDKLSSEVKKNLVGEIEGLLNKVTSMTESSSS